MAFDHQLLLLAVSLLLLVFTIAWWNQRNKRVPPPPPGPRGLPLLGYLPFVDPQLHRCFGEIAKSYGPIFKLRLGRKLCVVLSSPSVAKELLKDHDLSFADRDVPVTAKAITYGGIDMGWGTYGQDWRIMRKVFSREMMSNPVLEAYSRLRRREVRQMVGDVHAKAGTRLDVAEIMFATSLNVLTSMLWGGSETLDEDERRRVRSECRRVTQEALDLVSKPNVSDLFPVLSPLDLQGLVRKTRKVWSWFDQILESIIDQRMRLGKSGREGEGVECKDFLDLLLRLRKTEENSLSVTHVKALLMDILVAGTETTSTTLEWAMAEVMQHPEIMKKAQQELEEVVGRDNTVEESHLSKLHYVSAILMEALRLHPALPLLVPRSPREIRAIGGFTIPKGARVLVNVWAIHRDPQAWEDPLVFNPERFSTATGKWDSIGNDYRYLPFGSGRRKCVGVPMAEIMLLYVFASLLHSFEWQLGEGTQLDLADKFGLVLKKEKPLVIIPKPRLSNPDLYS